MSVSRQNLRTKRRRRKRQEAWEASPEALRWFPLLRWFTVAEVVRAPLGRTWKPTREWRERVRSETEARNKA